MSSARCCCLSSVDSPRYNRTIHVCWCSPIAPERLLIIRFCPLLPKSKRTILEEYSLDLLRNADVGFRCTLHKLRLELHLCSGRRWGKLPPLPRCSPLQSLSFAVRACAMVPLATVPGLISCCVLPVPKRAIVKIWDDFSVHGNGWRCVVWSILATQLPALRSCSKQFGRGRFRCVACKQQPLPTSRRGRIVQGAVCVARHRQGDRVSKDNLRFVAA